MKDCIYDTTEVYMVDLSLMDKYYGKLEPGNIIMVDCGLEKYRKTKFMKCDKVALGLLADRIGCGSDSIRRILMALEAKSTSAS